MLNGILKYWFLQNSTCDTHYPLLQLSGLLIVRLHKGHALRDGVSNLLMVVSMLNVLKYTCLQKYL